MSERTADLTRRIRSAPVCAICGQPMFCADSRHAGQHAACRDAERHDAVSRANRLESIRRSQ